MLKQAHLARVVSEEASDSLDKSFKREEVFDSLDKSFSEYQDNHPQSTSYRLIFPTRPTELELKAIALHFAAEGYDVRSIEPSCLIISWADAKEGWTGTITIINTVCRFKQASYQKNED